MKPKPLLGAREDAARDADGLIVRRHPQNVLMVAPRVDFADEALRYVRSCLYVRDIGTRVVSTTDREPLRGRLQDFFVADGTLGEASIDGFDALVFCGGEGALALALDPDALRLARDARRQSKPIAAWGHALAILANADVIRGASVTGVDAVREQALRAGALFSGKQLECGSALLTARDDAVGMRLGRALADRISGSRPR